jgi:hypothetical protein
MPVKAEGQSGVILMMMNLIKNRDLSPIKGGSAMADDQSLKPEDEALIPEDFPVHKQQKKIVKAEGKTIAEASNQKTAEDVSERLNAEEDRRDEDRWSA